MKILLSVLFGAATAALAQDLQWCGSARYDPAQYTCFDGDFLCPIENGEPTLRCGDACYKQDAYGCSNGVLVPNDPSDPDLLLSCGDAKYSPSQYVCFDNGFLCPVINGNPTLRCGDACYNYDQYKCEDGQLVQIQAQEPQCHAVYDFCVRDGMVYPCCEGLLCIATRCRDPADFDRRS
ncbi:carbohydrate binding-domain-containing protein [Lineolata rhizophorae]|uniref:Carbohydrate binding-domain-containing protein n=1 Tax=Lineolata rhizophorae TaxID=578093 RepID=A0A6A6NQS5_9PEZI|nr:carbohydrate binding-domain-containing protein [Lineolata rhizophorae]